MKRYSNYAINHNSKKYKESSDHDPIKCVVNDIPIIFKKITMTNIYNNQITDIDELDKLDNDTMDIDICNDKPEPSKPSKSQPLNERRFESELYICPIHDNDPAICMIYDCCGKSHTPNPMVDDIFFASYVS